MGVKTNAMRLLDKVKATYEVHTYNPKEAIDGMEVAAALNENPQQVFKTLVTVAKSGVNYVFMLPVCAELDLKKAAAAVGEKAISMLKNKELLPLTGYIHGGCSPLGMKKVFLTVIDKSAENYPTIIFSGGKRGLQIETALDELQKTLVFKTEYILQE